MKYILFLFSTLISLNTFADGDYRYYVDLTAVKDDKLTIRLTPPDITDNETVFMFPAMVPGTYDVYDFGRFISNFKAEGKDGVTITVTKLDDNSYKLSPANAIKEISYDVEDSWDTDIKDRVVFEPGGSNIEEGKNFSLNTHCFFGYFKNKIRKHIYQLVTHLLNILPEQIITLVNFELQNQMLLCRLESILKFALVTFQF